MQIELDELIRARFFIDATGDGDLCARLGLETFSSGHRQRIALARALAIEPRVLLLDEPFGALDAKVRKDLRKWLREFHDQTQLTTLFVTHDQEEAFELADRVVILHKGQVQQIGKPRQIRTEPANPFVADFLGVEDLDLATR